MRTFLEFFNITNAITTPNTRVKHQANNAGPKPDDKHQNLVARRHGADGAKLDPIIDNIVKNKRFGKWTIVPANAKRILNKYGITHTENKSYSKAIKQTGIYINYDVTTKKFTISRNRPK